MNEKLNAAQKYSDFDIEVIPHLTALKNYAFKMTRDFDDSKDLLQETLMKAFKFFDNYEKGSNAKAWLFKIMQNLFINNYRKKIKQPITVDYDDVQNFYENIKLEDIIVQHCQSDIYNDVLDDEIFNALSLLPEDFRTIAYLCDVEGYSYKETSDFIDCPIGTVRSRLHRTRKILYSLLYNYAKQNGYLQEKNVVIGNYEMEEVLNNEKKTLEGHQLQY
ncbi:MAG: sigma-70 family RNA polymerase sigma factor [bacterium]